MLTNAYSMLHDIEYLVGKLGKIEAFGDLGTYLMRIIECKEIGIAPPKDLPPVPTKEEKLAAKGGEEK